MTEKIIIDEMMEEIGLDVRKCTYLEIEEDAQNYPEIGGTYTAFECNYYSRDCKFIDNCVYKKYLRKEQECEELKKNYFTVIQQRNVAEQQLDQLKAKNEELKKANLHIENNREHKANKLNRIEKLILACTTGYTDEFIQELLVILYEPEPSSFENKYKQALTEIKEICNSVWGNGLDEEVDKFGLILQKCEVTKDE